jgi:predicted nuclease of restriction endonuclease-like RecB superfamily
LSPKNTKIGVSPQFYEFLAKIKKIGLAFAAQQEAIRFP